MDKEGINNKNYSTGNDLSKITLKPPIPTSFSGTSQSNFTKNSSSLKKIDKNSMKNLNTFSPINKIEEKDNQYLNQNTNNELIRDLESNYSTNKQKLVSQATESLTQERIEKHMKRLSSSTNRSKIYSK